MGCSLELPGWLLAAATAVAVVLGSPRNFKITQPGDLALAEFYLSQS